jgi:UDP-N-acetylmuramoylalanine--D-glutamate ligase
MQIQEIINKTNVEYKDNYISSIASKIIEIRKDNVRKSLNDCSQPQHRLEFVGKIRDVEFINDSRSTNVISTWRSLTTIEKPIIWIAGGLDNGNDYFILKEIVKEKVKAIVCIGKDNSRIHRHFNNIIPKIINTTNMMEAVDIAYKLSKPGYAVVLSPACPSFDLYESFDDRGNQFKNAVKEL